MGNTAPRRRISVNAYATPQKAAHAGLRNSMQNPAMLQQMTGMRTSGRSFGGTGAKSGKSLYGASLPYVGGGNTSMGEGLTRESQQNQLSSLIDRENYQQKTLSNYTAVVGVNRFSKQLVEVKKGQIDNFIIPAGIRPRVPRNWMNCL